MNFLSKKVLEYQKKKLEEAQNNLQYHISRKKQIQDTIENPIELEKQNKMIKIWTNNIERIKKEIKKLEKQKDSK